MQHTMEWNGQPLTIDTDDRIMAFPDMQGLTAMMYMPGYDDIVMIPVNGPGWHWNGDRQKPTFSPSLLSHGYGGHVRNHVFVREGIIEYLHDCCHTLAGKKIELPRLKDWPEEWQIWKDD